MTAPFSYAEIETVDNLEFEIPCGVKRFAIDCPFPAEWTITKTCCGADAQWCDLCFRAENPCACITCGIYFKNGRDMIKNAHRIK